MTRGAVAGAALLCTIACGAPGKGGPPSRSDAVDRPSAPANGVFLTLRVVNNTAAMGLDPPKALELTLRNPLGEQRVWLDGRLCLTPGTVDLVLIGEDGQRIYENCRRNSGGSETWDYVMLGPGDAISRMLFLKCYELPNSGRIWATATYENKQPKPPPSPLPMVPLFRGPVVSNTVVFTLRD